MHVKMTTIQSVIQKVLSLPADKQELVLKYAERIQEQSGRPRAKPLSDPMGMAADIGCDLSLEDFRRNRRAMWGSSSDRELE